MTTQHTPGPWRVEESTRTDQHIMAGKRWIATASNHDFHPTQDENDRTRANARLISAAPDLLAALQELVAEWDARHADEDHRTGYTLDTYGVQLARAAIAKATGEA